MPRPSPRRLLVVVPPLLAVLFLGYGLWQEHGLRPYEPPPYRAPLPPLEDEARFLVLGDWGSGHRAQSDVARAMESAAREVGGVHAGLMLGDNFYNHGVTSTDDPQWAERFEQPYDTRHLGRLTWHAVLGNHDYEGNTAAQIAYTPLSGGRWHMPREYYRVDLPDAREPLVTILALDTNRKFDRWDEEMAWLEEELASLLDAEQAVIVIGHHPILSYCRKPDRVHRKMRTLVKPLFDRYPVVDLYLSGHAHNLEMIVHGGLHQAVIGGGGKRLHPAGDGPGSLFHRSTYGFGLLRVTRERVLLELRDANNDVLFRWGFVRQPAVGSGGR